MLSADIIFMNDLRNLTWVSKRLTDGRGVYEDRESGRWYVLHDKEGASVKDGTTETWLDETFATVADAKARCQQLQNEELAELGIET